MNKKQIEERIIAMLIHSPTAVQLDMLTNMVATVAVKLIMLKFKRTHPETYKVLLKIQSPAKRNET